METTNLGKIVLLPVGTWTDTKTYNFLDFVEYQGSNYVAKKEIPLGIQLNNTEYWQLLAEKGEQGNSINNVQKISTSDIVDTYRINFSNGNYFDYEITNGRSLYLNFEVSTTTGDLYVDFLEEGE